MSTTSVVDICAREQVRHICITGGEPLFQSKPLAALIRGLLECGKSISVETNGSLPVSKLPRSVKRVIDVKTPSTGESESFLAENLKAISPLDELKFVISDKKDFKYSIRFLADHGIDCGKVKVLFSPNLSKKGVAVKLAKWIIQSGIEVRFQPQLHKLVKERPLYLVKHRPRYRL